MGVKDRIKEIMLALGIAVSPVVANAEFNIFNPATWGGYKPGSIAASVFEQDTSRVDTTSVVSAKPSGGNLGSLLGVGQSEIDKARKEWEQKIAEIEKKRAEEEKNKGEYKVQEIKKANIDAVNAAISALYNEVDPRVLNIVLPAWSLSPATRNSLEVAYGTGLTDLQYKQLLFWDEYKYAKIKAGEICAQLGIAYNEVDAKEFALAYASMATLGYGIGRPNMRNSLDIATATMQANVDSSQWSLLLVLQYLPRGIQTKYGYVNLDYPKSVIADVWKVYNRTYVDYGSGVSPVPVEKPSPTQSTQTGLSTKQPQSSQQPSTQPSTQEEIKVQTALETINSALAALQKGKEMDYEKKVRYFDRTINYGEMLYVIKTKSSTIDVILLEANGAGLISYYQEGGVWKACLTPDAIRVLKENYGYKDKGNFGKNIENLNRTLQKMANARNSSAEEFDNTLAKALEDAGRDIVPQGQILVDALKDGGVKALQNQITNYQAIQSGNQAEIDSAYSNRINQLSELKKLVEEYSRETNPTKKASILEEIGKLEARMNVKLQPSVYEQLTGRKYEGKGSGVPSADEVLEKVDGIPKTPGDTLEKQQPGSVGNFEIVVGAGEVTPDNIGNTTFQPSGYDFPMTVNAYLETLPVSPHIAYDEHGVEYEATALTPEEKAKVLEKLADDIKAGKIKTINERTIKEAVKEATGLDVSMDKGELQDWKTAFKPRGYRCNGTPKNGVRV